jgi:hypothetical protein
MWSVATIGVCLSGVLERGTLGVAVLFAFYMLPIIVTVALYQVSPAMRAWMLGLDTRLLLALHISRWGGFAMCVAAGRITSPRWAISGGIGDCTAATAMGALALYGFMKGRLPRRPVLFWNGFGMLDAMHVGTLATLYIPSRIGVLAGNTPLTNASLAVSFPFNLITVLFVPLLFSIHLIIWWQARTKPATITF